MGHGRIFALTSVNGADIIAFVVNPDFAAGRIREDIPLALWIAVEHHGLGRFGRRCNGDWRWRIYRGLLGRSATAAERERAQHQYRRSYDAPKDLPHLDRKTNAARFIHLRHARREVQGPAIR